MSTYFTRQKKDRDYTVVDNTYIRDNRLSWKAKGLFTYLLSLPEDWKIYLSELQTHAEDGRDSLMSAIASLEAQGYLSRVLVNPDNKFSGYNYEIIEQPSVQPATGKPLRKTRSGKPAAENPQLLSTDEPSTNRLSTNKATNLSSPAELDDKSVAKKIDDRAVELASLLHRRVHHNYPHLREDPKAIDNWAADIDKLNRIDGRDWQLIEAVIKWTQQDNFWKQNIKSGKKLRLQFDELLVRISAERDKAAKHKAVFI